MLVSMVKSQKLKKSGEIYLCAYTIERGVALPHAKQIHLQSDLWVSMSLSLNLGLINKSLTLSHCIFSIVAAPESQHHSVSGLVFGTAQAHPSEGGGDPERQQVSFASLYTRQT